MLHTIFDLRKGEGRQALLFVLLTFLLGTACSYAVTVGESLFLVHIGSEQLGTSYLLAACFQFMVSGVILFTAHKVEPKKIIQRTLSFTILCYTLLLAGFLFTTAGSPLLTLCWYMLKAISEAFILLLLACFWNFVEQFYPLQTAKRHYGLFASGFFLGMATGGALIAITFPLIHIQGVCGVYISILFTALCLTQLIHHLSPIPPIKKGNLEPIQESLSYFRHLVHAISTSPFLILLVLVQVFYPIVETITEFTYFKTFEHTFAGEDQLVAFIGQSKSWVYTATLLFGSLVFGRLVQRFGVNSMAILTPIGFTLLFFAWPYFATLPVALVGFVLVESFGYILDDNCHQLYFNGISPKIRTSVRMLSTFLEPLGILIGGSVVKFAFLESKLLGLFFSILLLTVALSLCALYPRTLRPQKQFS